MGDAPFRWILKHIGIFYEPEIAVHDVANDSIDNGDVEEERADVVEYDSD